MRKILSLASGLLMLLPASAAADNTSAEAPDVLEMSLDQNINYPQVPKKAKSYVASVMDNLKRMLNKSGYEARLSRDGEVVEFSVRCDKLFAPGAVDLKPGADKVLHPLGAIVRDNTLYKVLVAVHTDDTGDEEYADSISAARANAIDDYLWTLAGEIDTNLVPYGIGKDEPVKPNNSMAGRAANRRVEFFIVPDQELIARGGAKFKLK